MGGVVRRPFFRGTMMGHIPPWQSAAIDVLDRLVFNQILVFCAFGESERDWLARIMGDVSSAVRETGATGLQAECLKHGVLCLMEILLSEDIDKLSATGFIPHIERTEGLSEKALREVQEYTRYYFQAFICAMLEKVHGESMAPAMQIADNLAEAFRCAPATVRYRLAERCLAYEFQQAPLDCMSWLANSGVILSAKYPAGKLAELPAEAVFARIGLLCEFESVRNHIRSIDKAGNIASNIAAIMLDSSTKLSERTVKALLRQKYLIEEQARLDSRRNKVLSFNTKMLRDAAYIREYYARVGRFYTRFRIWQGTLASWLGALGAVMVEIDRSLHHTDKSIYTDFDNGGTITDNVVVSLRKRGFTVTGRTLYERHRYFSEKIFRQVRAYYRILDACGVAVTPHYDDIYYYGVIINTIDL